MTPPSSPGMPVVRAGPATPPAPEPAEARRPRQLGKYQVLRKLATGGMAEVFLAKATSPLGVSKTVVLKCIRPHLARRPEFLAMFLSEARLVTQLNHPNIVQVFDAGEVEETCFLVMEYVDGAPLSLLAQRATELRTPIPVPLCARLIASACEGLAYAHELVSPESGEPLHLVHRDISPDNIMLTRTGTVKVLDFGIAKSKDHSERTKTGTIKGKLAYLPPERLRGAPGDVQGDVFSLGLVLYELVCGQKPYEAQSEFEAANAILNTAFIPIESRRADVPRAFRRILHKAIAKKREERYQNCRELQADLERFLFSTRQPVGPVDLASFFSALDARASAHAPALPPLFPERTRPRIQPPPGAADAQPAPAPTPPKPSGRPTQNLRPVRPPPRIAPAEERATPTPEPAAQRSASPPLHRRVALAGLVLCLASVGVLASKRQGAAPVAQAPVAAVHAPAAQAAPAAEPPPPPAEQQAAPEPPRPEAAAPVPAEPPLEITVLHGPEKHAWLESAAISFEEEHPHIRVKLVQRDALEGANAILAGKAQPTLWSPSDSLALRLLESSWRSRRDSDVFAQEGADAPRSLFRSPLVLVAWQDRANLLMGEEGTLTWGTLLQALAAPEGWSDLGGKPEWGHVKLGHPSPRHSSAGALALLRMVEDTLRPEAPDGEPVMGHRKSRAKVKRLVQDVARVSSTTDQPGQDLVRFGPERYDVAAMYENQALSQLEQAHARWGPLRVYYPPTTTWSDHPLALLQAPWVTEPQRRAARAFMAFLHTRPMQELALAHGFRPSASSVSLLTNDPQNPFARLVAYGVQVHVPEEAPAPDAEHVLLLRELWGTSQAPLASER